MLKEPRAEPRTARGERAAFLCAVLPLFWPHPVGMGSGTAAAGRRGRGLRLGWMTVRKSGRPFGRRTRQRNPERTCRCEAGWWSADVSVPGMSRGKTADNGKEPKDGVPLRVELSGQQKVCSCLTGTQYGSPRILPGGVLTRNQGNPCMRVGGVEVADRDCHCSITQGLPTTVCHVLTPDLLLGSSGTTGQPSR